MSPSRFSVLAVFALTGVVYLVSLPQGIAHHPGTRHHVWLAQAFLAGRLDVGADASRIHDLTIHAGRVYVPFPPLPAVLLTPFVAFFGTNTSEAAFGALLGATNVTLLWLVLARLGVDVRSRGLLIALFAFGTVHWYASLASTVYYLAHLTAFACLALYCLEVLGPARPARAAIYLGLACLARLHLFLAFPFFVALKVATARREQWSRTRLAREFALFVVVGLVFALLMGIYNYARFDNALDFGYGGMTVDPVLAPRYAQGSFNIVFLPENLYYFLLSPPTLSLADGFALEPSWWGMGLVFVSPALLLAVRGLGRSAVAIGAAAAAALVALPDLLYYNTGWKQFGYRFALDFMPFLCILAGLAIRDRPTRTAVVLVAVSIAVSYWGMRWYFNVPLFG